MPSTKLAEFIRRLGALEAQLTCHLEEAAKDHDVLMGMAADAKWTKWIAMGIAGVVGLRIVAEFVFRS